MANKTTVTITTDASGDATVYSCRVSGRILALIYARGDLDNSTTDFTVTTEDTLQNVWVESDVSASKTIAPRQATHSTAGVAALYASGGTAVLDYIHACNERIKIVVAQGGNAKTGTLTIITDE